jgi:excinuclease ABC subunit A
MDKIIIRGAREHNLKNISLELPRNKMIVFTGLSGSGKSSLAFDTIFAEGQRRYVESLSAYARQFLGQMQKPDVDEIEGLSPAISIDQKAHSANPRSTVATITEIYDYLRVLFARVGQPHCVICERPIKKMTVEEMVSIVADQIVTPSAVEGSSLKSGRDPSTSLRSAQDDKSGALKILSPLVRGRKGEYHQLLYDVYNAGFQTVRVDGKFRSLRKRLILSRYFQHTIELVVDEIPVTPHPSLLPLREKEATRFPLPMGEGRVRVDRQRVAEAIEIALDKGVGVVTVIYPDKKEQTLSSKFSCPEDGFSFPEIEPRLFSFNSPYGYCPHCTGLGTASLFSEEVCPVCLGKRLRPESLAVKIGGKNICDVTAMSIKEAYEFFESLTPHPYPLPQGEREDKMYPLPVGEGRVRALRPAQRAIAEPVLREVISRLEFMINVGLDYLTLNRTAGTLSGGEAQRIRLASQIGSRLVGALYVLDEPTIGLHQRDNDRLVATLEDLRDIGNTIIVVEHDEDTILSSDYLVDLGPGAGKHGGQVVVEGPTTKLLTDKKEIAKSLTLQYLTKQKSIALPERRRSSNRDVLKVRGAKEHNLKNLDVDIPLRRFVCLTGVSGSGKSTLMHDIIYKTLAKKLNHASETPGAHKALLGLEYLDKVVLIDQSAIGRTPRSNPATYTGAWSHIRDLFAALPEARARGYRPGRFSFNVPAASAGGVGGRCENCEGHGQIAIEMHFLPTVWVTCDVCQGERFDQETLGITFKEKNIAEVLRMTIEEAEKFFRDIPAVYDKLKILNEVGLEYLELGQSATTLSGGEAQRVKLANELSRRDTGRALYLLDEPTVGLHYEDVKKLLAVLERLVARGNTVLVIEHNLDVIKTADYIIDLGPEGGEGGGRVVAQGTPEEIARRGDAWTGKYLKRAL